MIKYKIESIQALRGIAAVLICCFHMRGLINSQVKWGNVLFDQASVGVLVFFVISGIIIVITTQNIDTSFSGIANFLAKRILRIVPLYYILTFVLLLAIGKFGTFIIHHPDLLMKSFLFMPTGLNSVGGAYGMPVLKVGWTLNYEIFFYLLVAISLLFKKWRWYAVIVGISLLVWVCPYLMYGYIILSPSGNYPFSASYLQMISNPLMLCFLIGVSIGLFYCSDSKLPSSFSINIGLAASAAIFCLSLAYGESSELKYYLSIIGLGLIFLFLMMKEKQKPLHFNQYLVKLGDVSFSIYLVHTIIIVFLSDTLRQWGIPGSCIFLVNLALILLSALLLYSLIEKKMTSDLLKLLRVKK